MVRSTPIVPGLSLVLISALSWTTDADLTATYVALAIGLRVSPSIQYSAIPWLHLLAAEIQPPPFLKMPSVLPTHRQS